MTSPSRKGVDHDLQVMIDARGRSAIGARRVGERDASIVCGLCGDEADDRPLTA